MPSGEQQARVTKDPCDAFMDIVLSVPSEGVPCSASSDTYVLELPGKPDCAFLASVPENTFVVPLSTAPSTHPSPQLIPKPYHSVTTPSKMSNAYKSTRPINPQTSTMAEYKWLKRSYANKPRMGAWTRSNQLATYPTPNTSNLLMIAPDTHELYNETTIHTVLELKTSRMRDIQKWSPVLAGHLYTPAQSRSDTKQIKRGAKLTRRSVLANKNVSELPTQTHKSHRDFPHHVHNLVMQELLNNIPRTQRSNNECSTKKCYWKHAGISISKRSSNGKPIPLACKFKAL